MTIEEDFPKDKSDCEKDTRFKPIAASEKGCRAHLTLATAPGAKPVNAGIDLMEIVQAEEKKIEKYSFHHGQNYANGTWLGSIATLWL